jgi:hypothetical protein
MAFFLSQDFAAFSTDSEFDEIEWINSVFKNVSKNEKEVNNFSSSTTSIFIQHHFSHN